MENLTRFHPKNRPQAWSFRGGVHSLDSTGIGNGRTVAAVASIRSHAHYTTSLRLLASMLKSTGFILRFMLGRSTPSAYSAVEFSMLKYS